MRKRFIAVVALVAFIGGAFVGVLIETQQRSKLDEQRQSAQQQQARREQLASYYGVKLGSPKSEVGYRLGYPSSVQAPLRPDPARSGWQLGDEIKLNKNGEVEGTAGANDPPGGSALKTSDEWNYDFSPDRVTVTFDPVKKTVMSITCMEWKEGGPSKCRPILGVTVGSTEADVLKAFGNPDAEEIEGIDKSMTYKALGVQFMLAKSHVYLVTKTAPAH